MKRYGFLLLVCSLTIQAFAQQPDFHLRYRPDSAQYQVVSIDDIKQLTAQGATLDAIKERLGTMDVRLNKIQTMLEKDVLPTIHVMDFFKWLFALIVAAIIGAAANNWLRNRHAVATP